VIVALLSLGQIHSFMNIHGTVLQRMNSALPVVTVSSYSERTKLLRDILNSKEITIMPCCYDGLSARIVEQSGSVSCENHLESFLVIYSTHDRIQLDIYDWIRGQCCAWTPRYRIDKCRRDGNVCQSHMLEP
jgi:hypothetical protein